METLEKIQTVQKTRDLPLGQRALKCGFSLITTKQLGIRFACSKIQNAENQRRENAVIDSYLKGKNITKEEFLEKHELGTSWSGAYGFTPKRNGNFITDTFRLVECTIAYDSLDSYAATEIPNRVLENLKIAKSIGFTEFVVAYPVMREVPQKDPVLLAVIRDSYSRKEKMFEIDMWE